MQMASSQLFSGQPPAQPKQPWELLWRIIWRSCVHVSAAVQCAQHWSCPLPAPATAAAPHRALGTSLPNSLEPLLPGVVLMSPRLALGGVRVRCPHQHANLLPFPALYTKNESHLYRQLPPHFFAPLHSRSPLKEMVMLVVSLAFPPSLSESFVET